MAYTLVVVSELVSEFVSVNLVKDYGESVEDALTLGLITLSHPHPLRQKDPPLWSPPDRYNDNMIYNR